MATNQTERRMYPRRSVPWSATAKGVDANGVAFECATLLHNISEGGIFMRIAHCVKNGSQIEVRFDSPTSPQDRMMGGRITARGVILRVEPQPLATCDVAIRLTQPLKFGGQAGEAGEKKDIKE